MSPRWSPRNISARKRSSQCCSIGNPPSAMSIFLLMFVVSIGLNIMFLHHHILSPYLRGSQPTVLCVVPNSMLNQLRISALQNQDESQRAEIETFYGPLDHTAETEPYANTSEMEIIIPSDLNVSTDFIEFSQKEETAASNAEDVSSQYMDMMREGGFSACLLVKDDNDILAEWLAFHYTTLPLRHLVIAVDPVSATSPMEIVERWNSTQLDIQVWTNDSFVPVPMQELHNQWHEINLLKNHRSRQWWFISKCSAYHKAHKRTWVAHIDSDEYLVFNHIADDDPGNAKIEKIGEGQVKILEGKLIEDDIERLEARARLPHLQNVNATVLDYMQSESKRNASWVQNSACVVLPRLFFSAVESSLEVLKNARVEELVGMNVTKFTTLRYFTHAKKGNFKKEGTWSRAQVNPKVVIDVSKVPQRVFRRSAANPHRPYRICNDMSNLWNLYSRLPLRVNHYLGSWEQYSFRGDSRRTREKFDGLANVNGGSTFDLQPWLANFVADVGSEKSSYLLQGVGGVVQ